MQCFVAQSNGDLACGFTQLTRCLYVTEQESSFCQHHHSAKTRTYMEVGCVGTVWFQACDGFFQDALGPWFLSTGRNPTHEQTCTRVDGPAVISKESKSTFRLVVKTELYFHFSEFENGFNRQSPMAKACARSICSTKISLADGRSPLASNTFANATTAASTNCASPSVQASWTDSWVKCRSSRSHSVVSWRKKARQYSNQLGACWGCRGKGCR